jgi:hypothetical protein
MPAVMAKFPSDDLEALPTDDDLDAATTRLTVDR